MKPKRKMRLAKMSRGRTINQSDLLSDGEQSQVSKILDSCAGNEISPAIALLKLMSVSRDSADLEVVIKLAVKEAASRHRAALAEIRALYVENRPACERVMTMSKQEPMTEAMTTGARISRLRATFDTWVEEDAALSVAAYTFGNPDLIRQTTQEIIDVLDEWGLLGPEVDALQIGCGTGRIEALLGSRVRLAWGIDISAKMISTAQQKVADPANIRFSQCSGRDLAPFEANSFNLVYAVDSFPYIVQAGAELVNSHFAEVARVLRDSGHFVIFHYSYHADVDRDRADVRRLAAAHGYSVVREAVTPFTIWDGVGYHLQKSAG
jgi:ubiquinone/menaquinone biosynthesis C-methylase UbiE